MAPDFEPDSRKTSHHIVSDLMDQACPSLTQLSNVDIVNQLNET